jgi:hypothetical protein
MNFQQQLVAAVTTFSVVGGIGFGLWQNSVGAGVFAAVTLVAIWRVQ